MAQALARRGLRFRRNVRSLEGCPDIVFFSARIVIFCDGDFWHGRSWKERRRRLEAGSNADYWVAKISTNMRRDRRISRRLRGQGWRVLRFWESRILRDADACAARVAAYVCADK